MSKTSAENWQKDLLAYLSSKHIDTNEFFIDLQNAIQETNKSNPHSLEFERKYDGYFDGSYSRQYSHFYSFYGSYKRATFLENLSDNDDYRLSQLEMREARLSKEGKYYQETQLEIKKTKERIEKKKKHLLPYRNIKIYDGVLDDYEMTAIQEVWNIKEIKERELRPLQQVDIRVYFRCYQLDKDTKERIGIISKRIDKRTNKEIDNDWITFSSGLSDSIELIELRKICEMRRNEWIENLEQSNMEIEIIHQQTIIVRLGL